MKWLEPQVVEVPQELQAAVGGHPLVAQALVQRGLRTTEAALAFLDPLCYHPTSPLELPDMPVAVQRLQTALARNEAILVWGDFDTDGMTATAVLVEALQVLGARVEWYVPDRLKESHGVHWGSLQPYLGRGARVLLTCDTGVTAHETLALARNAGLDVLVTDHHDLPADLPPALAVVNPKRLPSDHPFHSLSGVGVAYELVAALGVPDLGLDLTALGLVADLAELRGEARYLVQRGLQALRCTTRVGLQALWEVAEIDPTSLDEDRIAFALAPRLNALGRLSQASTGVELFLTSNVARARTIAAEMEAFNVRRQFLSRQVTEAAREQARRDRATSSAPVWVLAQPNWPAGILGIAAGRLAERYHRPVVLIANPPDTLARGSARSVPGVDIHAALAAHRELFSNLGGHPMAAGFALDSERIAELRRALTQSLSQQVTLDRLEPERAIAGYFSFPELSLNLWQDLSRLAPFGAGNPPLTLATRGVHVTRQREIGRTQEHRWLELADAAGHTQEVVWWNGAETELPEGSFDLAYVLRANEFGGQCRLQLQWVDARGARTEPLIAAAPRVVARVADYRTVSKPLPVLQALWHDSVQLWAEGITPEGLPARSRAQLEESAILAVWTVPPEARVWNEALRVVQPQQVYLFAVQVGLDDVEAFLRRLLGLVKHALGAWGGRLTWQPLAAATGQRVETVQVGVRWLVARGLISVAARDEQATYVQTGGQRDERDQRDAQRQLADLLRETAAYRAYWRQEEARRLVEG